MTVRRGILRVMSNSRLLQAVDNDDDEVLFKKKKQVRYLIITVGDTFINTKLRHVIHNLFYC